MAKDCALNYVKPLLSKVNPHATVITPFTYAMSDIMNNPMQMYHLNVDERAEVEKDVANIKPYFPTRKKVTEINDPDAILRWTASSLFKDYNIYFDR